MHAPMIQRQLMLTVLVVAVVGSARSAEAQRYCDAPVPNSRNQSEVALYVAGFSSSTGDVTPSSVSHLNYHEMQNHFFQPSLRDSDWRTRVCRTTQQLSERFPCSS